MQASAAVPINRATNPWNAGMPPSLRTLIDALAIAALWGRSKARAEFCRALRIARENCRNTAWRNNAANESLLG
jgi:hypothetical protein